MKNALVGFKLDSTPCIVYLRVNFESAVYIHPKKDLVILGLFLSPVSSYMGFTSLQLLLRLESSYSNIHQVISTIAN
jgi:hypothetical protein